MVKTLYQILLVDDDPMMAKTLSDILRMKGYQVEVAHSALLALELLERDVSVDCVISDVKMPGMNGLELFRWIQTRFPELPVFLMTAYTEETLLRYAREEGVREVFTKPLHIPRLLEFLDNIKQS